MNSVWCFVLLSIGLVQGKAIRYSVPKDYVEPILKAAADCIETTGVGSDAVQKVVDANLENTEPFKKFLYCFSTKAGYVDTDGLFLVDKVSELIGDHKDKSKFIDAINLCNKNQDGGDVYDRIYKGSICFKDTSPIYFTL